jgi:hypothetical protein
MVPLNGCGIGVLRATAAGELTIVLPVVEHLSTWQLDLVA